MNTMLRTTTAVVLALGILSGCGGGGNGGSASSPPSAANTPPSIAGLSGDASVGQDTTSEPMSFSVSDEQSAAGELKITAESSNLDLVSPGGVAIGGSGQARTLTLTPEEGAAGSAVVTLRATDPEGLAATQTINVNVTTVELSFRQMVNEAFATPADGTPAATTGVTWVDDAADEPQAFDHLIER